MKRLLPLMIAIGLASPAFAAPSSQLTQSVANRLAVYNVRVDPDSLTTPQAAALHTLLVSERRYLKVRQRAEVILTSPRFRD